MCVESDEIQRERRWCSMCVESESERKRDREGRWCSMCVERERECEKVVHYVC